MHLDEKYKPEEWLSIIRGEGTTSEDGKVMFLLWRALGLEEQKNHRGSGKIAWLKERLEAESLGVHAREDALIVERILKGWHGNR